MSIWCRPTILAGALLAFVPSLANAGVVVMQSDHNVYAHNAFDFDSDYSNATTGPLSLTAAPTTNGLNFASNGSTITRQIAPGGGYLFSVESELTASANSYNYSYALSYGYEIFTVGANVTYSIAGILNLADGGYHSYIRAELHDVTAGSYPLVVAQSSRYDPSMDLTLGQPFGAVWPDTYTYTGLLSGTLIAGQQYRFQYNTYVYAYNGLGLSDDINGTALITLQIGDEPAVAAVPEPLSLTIWGLGGIGGVVASYFQRRRSSQRTPV